MMLASLLLAFALSAKSVLCASLQYEFTITNQEVSPNGGPSRSAVVVNGQTPGPLITGHVGDTVQIKVIDKLTDTTMAQGTSIHWHGLFNPRTADMDGPTWVTQCPIAPGYDFTYNITFYESGTYWYHSHVVTQYCDGLRGALVIYDPNDPLKHLYDVDDANTVITFSDWNQHPSPYAFTHFENPETVLINGLGRVPGGAASPLAVVDVVPEVRYRFRLVNMACVAGFNISIDSHRMTVIETDGTEALPNQTVDVVTIWPGQRLSVIVHANQSIGNYWIRAVPFMVGSTPSTEIGVNSAILRYAGAPVADPTTTQTGFKLLKEQNLISITPPQDLSGEPDIQLTFDIGLNAAGTAFTMNGQEYTPPSVPILLQILNGANPNDLLPAGTVIPLDADKLVELIVPGGSFVAPHPFHLHGHKFGVVRSAGSTRVNTLWPVLRDTVNTGSLATDAVAIRFRTNIPGPWIFHCHINYHLAAGLAVVLAENVPGQVSGSQSEIVTDKWKQLCPTWNSLTVGKQFAVNDIS